MKSPIIAFLMIISIAAAALAEAPAGYYNSVDTTNSTTLRNSLHNLIDDHVRFPYTSSSTDTWDILEAADEYPINSNTILDLYQNRLFTKFGGGTGPYNREHSWPKSYGFPSSGDEPYTDCHHLFLCDVEYNSARSNRPFGDSTSGTAYYTDYNDGEGGSGQPNLTGTASGISIWEAWDGRKGDVARAMFYMDVRYSGDVSGEPDLVLTDNASLIQTTDGGTAYMGLLSTLIEWHNADPVDAREMRHTDGVYDYQGNRNPFVDHPEYVSGVYLGFMSDVDDMPAADVPAGRITGIHPNPFNPTTRIELTLESAGTVLVEVYAVDGRKVRTLLNDTREPGRIDLNWNGRDDDGQQVPSGSYFCRLLSNGQVDAQKMVLLK
jgi:endonuclease I